MNFELRKATLDDDAFLEQLYADVRALEFAPLNLPAPALEQLIRMQANAQRLGYAAQFPDAESSIVWAGPYRIGRLLVAASSMELRLIDIALLGAFRGNGIGTRILEGLRERADALSVPLRLSVRPDNPAIHLYTRLGFAAVGGDAANSEMVWNVKNIAPESREAAVEAIPDDVAPGLTSAYFRSVKRKTVRVRSMEGADSELILVDVSPHALSAGPGIDSGDSFTLGFEGPEAALLAQGMYPLDFGEGAVFDIFVGPVSREGDRVRYEAVFNRAHPLAVE